MTEINNKAHDLLKALYKRKLKIATAESCTGGLIAATITEIPGSSQIFERGFITYSNQSKIELLTVPTFYLEDYGAVSRETAVAMAEGAILMSKADIGISVTGIAGPEGGTEDKPVGTIFIGLAIKGKNTKFEQHHFTGSRHLIRTQTVEAAFDMVMKSLEQ